jgi:GMP synthase PP-ATPase subunit
VFCNLLEEKDMNSIQVLGDETEYMCSIGLRHQESADTTNANEHRIELRWTSIHL